MDHPDPSQAASLEDLAWCLRHLRTLADTPTYRELERRTVHAEGVLPGTDLRRIPLRRTAIAEVLAGHAFPRKAFMLTFVEACGVDLREDRRWEQAWNRLVVRYQVQSAASAQVNERPEPEPQRRDLDEPGRDRTMGQIGGPRQAPEEISHPKLNPQRTETANTFNPSTQPWALTGFLEAADAASSIADSLLGRLAWREVERVTAFLRQLPNGQEITYDGEDREWLLGIIQETRRSIDAISLASVDAGLRGFDGGLWTSDLGIRYLGFQREAVDRKVRIRRIFGFENAELVHDDETFLRVAQMQRDAGIDVRMLDAQLIPDWLLGMVSDFVIFDDEIGYEVMPSASFSYGSYRPSTSRTILMPMPSRVKALKKRFEQLWVAADPERVID